MKKILIALTNTPTYGERNDATGLWLGEAAEFVDEVAQCCFEVDYVSPKGGYVPLDPRSMKKAYADRATFALYRSEDFQTRALARSLSPDETNPHDYAALYYTGGHGVMWDFPGSEGLARLGLSIYDQGGYLASVCHGIAGLLYLRVNGEYVVAGKNITGFTTAEERLSGKSGEIPFWNEKVPRPTVRSSIRSAPSRPMPYRMGASSPGRIPNRRARWRDYCSRPFCRSLGVHSNTCDNFSWPSFLARHAGARACSRIKPSRAPLELRAARARSERVVRRRPPPTGGEPVALPYT